MCLLKFFFYYRSIHIDVVMPTAGTISKCAIDPAYQLAIQTEGMIEDIVRHLSTEVSSFYCTIWQTITVHST